MPKEHFFAPFVWVLVVAVVFCLMCGLLSLRLAQRSCGNFFKHMKPNKHPYYFKLCVVLFHVLWFNFHGELVKTHEFDGATK